MYIALFLESERNGCLFAGSPNSSFWRRAAVTAVTCVLTRAFSAPQAKKIGDFHPFSAVFANIIRI